MHDETTTEPLELGETLETALEDFVLHAAYHLGSDIECSISVRHAGQSRRAASSGPRAARCDEVEYADDSGPCVAAMDTLSIELIPDLAVEDRWPAWRQAAQTEGFRSAAAFAVHVGPRADAALNLYSDSLDPWDRDRIVRADVYAQQLGLVLTLALQVERLQGGDSHVPAALEAQAEIDRAVGAAMAVHDCTAAEALAMLQAESTQEHLPLTEVARRVLRELWLPPG
ncbi:GAF and ANTAR domain-containing protein [Cellulomonas xylanilytica]|uniref:Transcriptional regulator n=1 Tax=Cellulomonas xylanilytica TaxID=233583 RepID=A0A510V231_9CELL|nr:GAF and ANTAR domain-containing protein [Cellulomonas xylanilytica]GEK20908.1 transcriptional regulator [Cellulomonas xylanilytica]